MIDFTKDEDIKKILESVFSPSAPLPDYREQLLKDLILAGDGAMRKSSRSLWKKPDLWATVAAVIILAIIGYGIWLPQSMVTKLLP